MSVVKSIHIAARPGDAMQSAETATALAGRGLDGDRYANHSGTFSAWQGDHELTLIEAEVLESLVTEHGIHLQPGATRRNVTTRGVRLNELVGKQFRIGAVLCEGTRLCEPCAHLERLTDIPGLVRLLAGRGGLRAIIWESGTIHVGDTITVCE
jgi:MOSC domain-containing protein YiiM